MDSINLENILKEENIILDVEFESKEQAIEQMVSLLHLNNVVTDVAHVIKDVHAREEEFATYIGHHISIPHARSGYVNQTAIAIAKLTNNIEWNNNGDKVNFVIMILVKEQESNLHIKILAQLARKLMHEEIRERLFNSKNPREIVQVFNTA